MNNPNCVYVFCFGFSVWRSLVKICWIIHFRFREKVIALNLSAFIHYRSHFYQSKAENAFLKSCFSSFWLIATLNCLIKRVPQFLVFVWHPDSEMCCKQQKCYLILLRLILLTKIRCACIFPIVFPLYFFN